MVSPRIQSLARHEESIMFRITSTAFADEEEIPTKHTCEGEDISPALQWASAPEGTQSLALIVDDPDAPDPDAPKMVWVHWVLYNLPPDSQGLPEGVAAEALPEGTCEGYNDWKATGWGGPCPPIGRHRYLCLLRTPSTAKSLTFHASYLACIEAPVSTSSVIIPANTDPPPLAWANRSDGDPPFFNGVAATV